MATANLKVLEAWTELKYGRVNVEGKNGVRYVISKILNNPAIEGNPDTFKVIELNDHGNDIIGESLLTIHNFIRILEPVL